MPMGAVDPQELLSRLMQADQFGIKLEVVQGDYSWEFFPSPLHQCVVGDIERSLWRSGIANESGCGCFTLGDAYVQFPDGSLKRPDLMVFCERPILTRQALTVVPEAVIEILSPGSEKKDLQIGAPFYLSQGVKDVVVVDPEGETIHHFRAEGLRKLNRPASIRLECGGELIA